MSRSLVRTRTKSDCGERQERHSSGEMNYRRCSSQESLLSDVLVEDTRVVKSEPKILGLAQNLQGLSLTSRPRLVSGSSAGAPSSGDEEAGDRTNRPRRMHAKMKSKLKLKNRKKSEATPGFRNKPEIVDGDEGDYETDDREQFTQQIRTNITSLIDHHQLVRLELLDNLYSERYQSSLLSPSTSGLGSLDRLGNIISRHCHNLIIISFNKEPHVVTKHGPFVLSYLARLHQVLYNCLKQNNFCPIELNEFEENYKQEFGQETFFDLDLIRECPGICLVPHHGEEYLDMTQHFRLGNEIVEVLKSRGGIATLDSLLGAYKSNTGKNIDPTIYGFSSLEQLISNFDLFFSLTGRNTVMLRCLGDQVNSVRPRQGPPKPDLVSQADGRRLLSLARNHGPPPGSSVVSPALRSVRQEGMFKSPRLRLTECISQQTKEQGVEDEELVMLGTGGNIVTVETDTSDAESVISRLSGRERKKSRMAASFAL